MVQLHVDLDGECASYLPVPPEMLAELMRESDPLLALIALGIRELAEDPGAASPDEEGARLETTERVRALESRMSHLSLETRLQFAIVWLEHHHLRAMGLEASAEALRVDSNEVSIIPIAMT